MDEHSSSYASSHSSDSEDDDIDAKPKWNNERQPVHSTPKGMQMLLKKEGRKEANYPKKKRKRMDHSLLGMVLLFNFYNLSYFVFVMFPALVDSVSNHVKPYWPAEATTASDSEDLDGAERLRVETKVNVELHQENKLNHTGERVRDTQQEREKPTGNGKDTATPNQHNSHSNHLPEQRKGRVHAF